jgi:tetratricopeptide (TPR) repeat protein
MKSAYHCPMSSAGTLTVLFTDLVASTALLVELGDERFRSVLAEHDAVVAEAISHHGGTLVKHTGDGAMAVFRSAGDAVRASIALQQMIEGRNRRSPTELAVRIGLSVGETAEEAGDYFGRVPVEASRLCDFAQAGQILASHLVAELVGSRDGHSFVTLGQHDLKGLPALVVVEVKWDVGQIEPPAGVSMAARLTAEPEMGIIGREHEMAQLADAYKHAAAGGGQQTIFLLGEAGIGKSTLAAAAGREAYRSGGIVLYGRCDDGLGQPYQPFVEALDHLVATVDQDLVDRHVKAHGGELTRILRSLRARAPEVASPRVTDPEAGRYLLLSAVVGLISEVARTHPITLILDDLHWADRETLILLRYIVCSQVDLRVSIIATYRDTDIDSNHQLTETLALLRREQHVSRISVGGLNANDVLGLLERIAGKQLDQLSVAFGHELCRDTDGNPYFVVELIRHLIESGAISPTEEGGFVVTSGAGDVLGWELPDSIREVIGHRLSQQSETDQRALDIASVLGREFELDLLGHLCQMTEDEILEVLERACASGILEEIRDRSGRFSFTHALVQHTIYSRLTATRRQLLHRRVAEQLEASGDTQTNERVVELAHHWVAATRPAEVVKAIGYACRAGKQALESLAPHDAIRWYQQALELLAHESSPQPLLRVRVLLGLGEAQRQVGDSGYRMTLLDAAALAQAENDSDGVIEAALANNRGMASSAGRIDVDRVRVLSAALDMAGTEPTDARARLLATLAAELTPGRDYERVRALADEALNIGRQLKMPKTLLEVLNLRFTTILVPETLRERLGNAQEAEEVASDVDDLAAKFWAAGFRTTAALEDADVDLVDRSLATATNCANRIGQPSLQWVAAFVNCWRSLLAGDTEQAELLAASALTLGTDTGQAEAFAFYGVQLLAIRWHQGRIGELLPLVLQAIEANPDLAPGFRPPLAMCQFESGHEESARVLLQAEVDSDFADLVRDSVWLASAALWAETAGNLEHEAASQYLYDRLEPWASRVASNGVCVIGCVAHHLGVLATVLRRSDAEMHFETALRIHQQLRAPFFVARTQLEWARTLLKYEGGGADAQRARQLLIETLETARQYGCDGLHRRATALLTGVSE